MVACHKHSACVEVLFDEEFIGGTSLQVGTRHRLEYGAVTTISCHSVRCLALLQGTCAAFRGKLLPWSTLLKTTAEPPGQKGGRPSTNGSQVR